MKTIRIASKCHRVCDCSWIWKRKGMKLVSKENVTKELVNSNRWNNKKKEKKKNNNGGGNNNSITHYKTEYEALAFGMVFVSWIHIYICCAMRVYTINARASHIKSVVHYAALSFASHHIASPSNTVSTHSIFCSLSRVWQILFILYLLKCTRILLTNHQTNKKKIQHNTHNLDGKNVTIYDNDDVWLIQCNLFLYRQFYVCHSCFFYWHVVIKWMIFDILVVQRDKKNRLQHLVAAAVDIWINKCNAISG